MIFIQSPELCLVIVAPEIFRMLKIRSGQESMLRSQAYATVFCILFLEGKRYPNQK
jgi:hypothetical protein